MSEYLSAAAAAMGLPEPIVERSAEARAAETGASVDEILRAWAGGEEVAAPAAPAEEEAPAGERTEEDVPEEPAVEEPTVEEPAVEEPVSVAVPEAAPPPPAPSRAPVPDEVTPAEAARLPEVITVPTAGIRERTDFAIPRWLTAVLVVAPLLALFTLGGSATGQCGEATELRVDVVTGDIVNCDGSEFTGQAVGGGGPDFIAMGENIYSGGAVSGVNCAGCHGPNGQGLGAFPALTGTLTTFGACVDHIDWVTLGSDGFRAQGLSTFGDTGKAINGGMPGHANTLSAEQIAAVAAFERVRFSGGEREAVLTDCGLAEGAGEGETPDGEGDDAATEPMDQPEASASTSG